VSGFPSSAREDSLTPFDQDDESHAALQCVVVSDLFGRELPRVRMTLVTRFEMPFPLSHSSEH